VTASLTGIVLGLLVGLRHAFEPDHLTAVSTLVAEARDGKRGALLGAIWGVGHTVSLLIVGIVLLVVGATLPDNVAAMFECGVSVMLILLGIRSIVRAIRSGGSGPVTPHRHGPVHHAHQAESAPHIHVGSRVVAWRPLIVGLVHGLAGSGALTALVFAQLPTTALRIAYITLFGFGSVAGMAIASGIAGASLHAMAHRPSTRRRLAVVTGAVSIVVGVLWSIPMIAVLLA
jgi:ABC-type nickel/cobalt efflux system permease component RcnA